MAGPKLTRRKGIGIALENVSGVAEDVTTRDANTTVYDPQMTPQDIFSGGEREPASGKSGFLTPTRGVQVGQATFTIDLSHNDAFQTLAQACGFALATNVLSPSNDPANHQTLTIVMWEGGRKKTLSGASGTFTIEASTSPSRVQASFTFSGRFETVVDQALPAEPTLETPYRASGMTLTLGGSAIPLVDTVSIDGGQDVQLREDITDDFGVAHYFVSDINPTLTLPTEAKNVADEDAYGKLTGATAEALSIVVTDPSTNTLTLAAPAAMRTDIGEGDRSGKLLDELTFGLFAVSGDDQLTITKSV